MSRTRAYLAYLAVCVVVGLLIGVPEAREGVSRVAAYFIDLIKELPGGTE